MRNTRLVSVLLISTQPVAAALLRAADNQLLTAKRSGRNHVRALAGPEHGEPMEVQS